MPENPPLFEGTDALFEHVQATQPHSVGCVIESAIDKIREATAEQLAAEIRKPSSGILVLRQLIRDEALARILTASAL